MARKQKHPEHVNLERYLISYADFITLLFATFVVLYALSQVDAKDFAALESSMKQAFAAPSVMQGENGIMQSSDSLFENQAADSMITPLMMEYMSQKYEEKSMQEIEKTVNEMTKEGELEGVEAFRTDKGVVIRFNDAYIFKSGSAELMPSAKLKLDKVGVLIAKKFVLHNMRIEGHTDNQAMNSKQFPSNWELSSARASSIIRYFISRFSFMPSLFTAVGFADTRPVENNNIPGSQAKNRRVEIFILKNRFNATETPQNAILKMKKEDQEKMQNERITTINRIEAIANVAKRTPKDKIKPGEETIILNKVYEKELKRISKETDALDSKTKQKVTGQGAWLKPPAAVSKIKVFD